MEKYPKLSSSPYSSLGLLPVWSKHEPNEELDSQPSVLPFPTRPYVPELDASSNFAQIQLGVTAYGSSKGSYPTSEVDFSLEIPQQPGLSVGLVDYNIEPQPFRNDSFSALTPTISAVPSVISGVMTEEPDSIAAFTCPDFINFTSNTLYLHGDSTGEGALRELVEDIHSHGFKAQPSAKTDYLGAMAALQRGISYYQKHEVLTLTLDQLNSLRISIMGQVRDYRDYHAREIEMWLVLDKRQTQDERRVPFHLGILSPLSDSHYHARWHISQYSHAVQTLWIVHQPGNTMAGDKWLAVLPDFTQPEISYAAALTRETDGRPISTATSFTYPQLLTTTKLQGSRSRGSSMSKHGVRGPQWPISTVSETKGTHICEICAKSFNSAAEKRNHQKNHDDSQKNYRCEDCNKAFRWPKDLRRHYTTGRHFGEKIYLCPYCDGKKYGRKDHLTRHIESRHPDKTVPTIEPLS